MLCPVTAAEIRVGNRRAGIGGVNELSVTGVNTHMGNTAGVCIGKEDHIADLQICLGNSSSHFVLICGSAVRRIAKRFSARFLRLVTSFIISRAAVFMRLTVSLSV